MTSDRRWLSLKKPAALVPLDARIAHYEVLILRKVLERQVPAQPKQRMIRMSRRYEGKPHQRLTTEPLWDMRGQSKIHAVLEQRLGRATKHCLDHLDARIGRLASEAV